MQARKEKSVVSLSDSKGVSVELDRSKWAASGDNRPASRPFNGILGRALDLPHEFVVDLALSRLAGKAEPYREGAEACIGAGYEHSIDLAHAVPERTAKGAWCLTGNQAAGYGALAAGVRFVAAYPITPAYDVLEWMAGGLEQSGEFCLTVHALLGDEAAQQHASRGGVLGQDVGRQQAESEGREGVVATDE